MKIIDSIRKLFTGRLSIDKVFDSVSKGLDNLGLTAQEKAEGTRQFVKDTLAENTERSKARRFIAKFFMFNYLLLFWVSIVAVIIDPELTKVIIEIAKAYSLGWAFLAIIGFYFGGYYIGKGGKEGKEKNKKSES
jgi:hypothetical protein